MGQTLRAITTKCQDFCAGWDLWEGQLPGAQIELVEALSR